MINLKKKLEKSKRKILSVGVKQLDREKHVLECGSGQTSVRKRKNKKLLSDDANARGKIEK